MMQFSLETMLSVIAKEHEMEFENETLLHKYRKVMDHFGITFDYYLPLLKAYHYLRNTQHNGMRIVKNLGPLKYKGCTFEVKKDQSSPIRFADWRHITWFTSEALEIYEKILKSDKYKLR